MNYPKVEMSLSNSATEKNVFLTYVCTINEGKPTKEHNDDSKHSKLMEDYDNVVQADDHVKVERSKALHELIEAHADDGVKIVENHPQKSNSIQYVPTTSNDESESSENEDATFKGNDNPHMLKLTKMKWLTEGREGSPDSRSPSLSPASSTCSLCSRESEGILRNRASFGDKYLSTILRLDKEHNLFGLSNIAIVGSRASKKTCKKDEKAVFHQTAIVQVCCHRGCCKYKSNTDLPSTLKCGGCRGCCSPPDCTCLSCTSARIYPPICTSYPTCANHSCCTGSKTICLPTKCTIDCKNCYGFKLTLKTKPKYEPTYVELTPRSSCILSKPIMSRSCHHMPQCIPPSSWFPYLMPCYWPARASAPCSNPTKCFHNPPCLAPRTPRSQCSYKDKCPSKCEDTKEKCTRSTCLGNVKNLKEQIEAKYGAKKA